MFAEYPGEIMRKKEDKLKQWKIIQKNIYCFTKKQVKLCDQSIY